MTENYILRKITHNIYQKRSVMPPNIRTNYRIERANGGLLCDLWFLTVGCIHDAKGGCIMCNYGKGNGIVNQEEILEELAAIVERLPWEFEDFLLTPSGSMLDEREVSLEMREKLAFLLTKVKAKRFIVESRADTITEEGIAFVKNVMPGAEKYIEIGLESSDDWILKYCINKEMEFQDFEKAVEKIHHQGVLVTANIGLGIPFMSERSAILQAVKSVRDAIGAGADSVVLFPYHVKHGTLLECIEQEGLYHQVSLWALVEVLYRFTEEERQRIQISWYKDYYGEERSYIYRSPQTCPVCQKQVMQLLDQYRDTQEERLVSELHNFPCKCREKWKQKISRQPKEIQIDEVILQYRKLAQIYGLDDKIVEIEMNKMQEEFLKGLRR